MDWSDLLKVPTSIAKGASRIGTGALRTAESVWNGGPAGFATAPTPVSDQMEKDVDAYYGPTNKVLEKGTEYGLPLILPAGAIGNLAKGAGKAGKAKLSVSEMSALRDAALRQGKSAQEISRMGRGVLEDASIEAKMAQGISEPSKQALGIAKDLDGRVDALKQYIDHIERTNSGMATSELNKKLDPLRQHLALAEQEAHNFKVDNGLFNQPTFTPELNQKAVEYGQKAQNLGDLLQTKADIINQRLNPMQTKPGGIRGNQDLSQYVLENFAERADKSRALRESAKEF